MDERAGEILNFWLEEIGPERWYNPPEGLDATIKAKYETLWREALRGGLDGWSCCPRSCLALLILLDQFPRNMFRGEAAAFASDGKAMVVASRAIRLGLDQRIGLPEREFFYLPLMHSETLPDQDKCMRLLLINFGPGEKITHSRAHRAVIRRFGRFPYRNEALGRASTAQEKAFLAEGGYAQALREAQAA